MNTKQKEALIRIPTEKLVTAPKKLLDDLRAVWPPDDKVVGICELFMYEDCKAFINNEKIVHIKGDHHIVEPIIKAIMAIIES